MTNLTKSEVRSLRRRIQSQALYHRRDQGLDVASVFRFRKAGTWRGKIDLEVPKELVDILSPAPHPRRVELPPGPLVAHVESDHRVLVKVAELFLSTATVVRLAALDHFIRGGRPKEAWISPALALELEQRRPAIGSSVEAEWLPASLATFDLIEADFRANLAGAVQASILNSDDSYQEYMERVIRPKMASFERERPPVLDPFVERELLAARITKKFSQCDSIEEVLAFYLTEFGYMPLGSTLSASAVLSQWLSGHECTDIWSEVWAWAEKQSSILATYHACSVFVEHPDWMSRDTMPVFLDRLKDVIAWEDSNSAPLWILRADLQRHYQYQVESFVVGISGTAAAAYSCWITDLVAPQFSLDPKRVEEGIQQIIRRELEISARRWAFSRSRTTPSRLRSAILWTPSIWSDALLVNASRNWLQLKSHGAAEPFRQFLMERLPNALFFDRVRTASDESTHLAFDEVVRLEDLEITDADGKNAMVADQLVDFRRKVEGDAEIEELLDGLCEENESFAHFCAISLRSGHFRQDSISEVVKKKLSSDEWRDQVFQRLDERAFDAVMVFLAEWHLHQDEDWLVRVPHIVAFECERSTNDERCELLFACALWQSLAVDIASPVVRLLGGRKRDLAREKMRAWRDLLEDIALLSEPWVASRVRGLLGSIARHL